MKPLRDFVDKVGKEWEINEQLEEYLAENEEAKEAVDNVLKAIAAGVRGW